MPRGALRHALARGADLPRLPRPELLPAQDPQAVPVQPLQEAGAAHRRHRVPGHQAAADGLVPGHLPPDAEQGRRLVDRAGPPIGREAGHRLADETQADAGDGGLMRAMAAREAAEPKLSGRVEMDDAYLGGERPGGRRGRGAAGKTPIVAAVETTAERRPKRLRLTVVKGFRKREVEKLAKAAIEPGATVVSDGLSCWPAVGKAGCQHFPIVT